MSEIYYFETLFERSQTQLSARITIARLLIKFLIKMMIQLQFQTSLFIRNTNGFWAIQEASILRRMEATPSTVGEIKMVARPDRSVQIYMLSTNQKVSMRLSGTQLSSATANCQ